MYGGPWQLARHAVCRGFGTCPAAVPAPVWSRVPWPAGQHIQYRGLAEARPTPPLTVRPALQPHLPVPPRPRTHRSSAACV